MKQWRDLSAEEQSEFKEGVVLIHGFKWKCYWKWFNEDTIQMYCEYGDWCLSYTSYKSLVVQ